ncbi:MAG: ABC transporter substrate-binding protein [Anaerolineae bacterium]
MVQQKRNNGSMTRRDFLKVAGAGTGLLVLEACVPSAPSPAATVAPAGEGQRGGKLRWATTREPAGPFDPALSVAPPATILTQWIHEPLVDIDEEYANTIPRLAESWEPEQDGQAWVFHLRQGVEFHHGREFVADDVVHTFQRILDPDFGSPGLAVYERIENIEKLDNHTVRFALAGANADFPVQLAAFQGKIVPHDLTNEQIDQEPRGTGPFKIDKYAHADRITLQRNENYWVEGIPYLDEIESVHIPEQATLANALEAGDVDVFNLPSGEFVELLQDKPGIALAFTPPMRKQQMFMQLDMEPFNDDRVRRAFKLIGDRVVMTEVAHPNIPARPDDDNPVIPPSPFRIDTNIWNQDLEEAKRLIAEAGYEAGLEVTLWAINDAPGILDFCLVFADWAKEIGVTVEIEGVSASRYYAEKWLQVPFGTVEWSPRPTADEQLRVAYTSDAAWNESHFYNPEFDRKLDEALGETDFERRKELYAELQHTLIEEGGQIIPYHLPQMAAIRDVVQNYKFHPLNWLDPRNVWLEA